jgi:dTDP-4-dehydrorhamnose reductase
MKVLITGSTGLLGTHLIKQVPRGIEVFGTVHDYKKTVKHPQVSYRNIELKDSDSVAKVFKKVKPDIVIHTAAHTSVDFCENNQEETHKTNIEGLQNILTEAKKYNSKIIFCSTNMSYDGNEPPYSEESVQNPGSYYGKTKVQGEELIINSGVEYTIVRLMTMYGWNWQPARKNMITMSIDKLSNQQQLWMTNDVFNNLLYVGQAADFFWKIVKKPKVTKNQKFNIAGAECTNRYVAVMELCKIFKLDDTLVTEVSSDYFKGSEVPRSPNTCFDTAKAQNVLLFKPFTLRQGLKAMLKAQL